MPTAHSQGKSRRAGQQPLIYIRWFVQSGIRLKPILPPVAMEPVTVVAVAVVVNGLLGCTWSTMVFWSSAGQANLLSRRYTESTR